jgi:hypothetical protein
MMMTVIIFHLCVYYEQSRNSMQNMISIDIITLTKVAFGGTVSSHLLPLSDQ